MDDGPGISYLEEMLGALTGRGVRFVVAGGVAVVLHGIERTTMDLDIALDLAPENVRRFGEVMASLGLRPLVPVPVEALSDPEMVRLMVEEKNAIVFQLADPGMPLRKIDVFLTEQLGYENLAKDSIPVEIPGIPLRVVSLERLLALKRAVDPPRDKVCSTSVPSSASSGKEAGMPEGIAGIIRALPQEAFREPSNRLAGLTYLERLRWLEQTAYFVWKHKGAARSDLGASGRPPT